MATISFNSQLDEHICCTNPQLPEGISVGHALITGNLIATCQNCDYACAYWECACELAHACN